MSRHFLEELDPAAIVLDYLHKKGYSNSYQTFNRELESAPSDEASDALSLSGFLACFDSGNRSGFFALWSRLTANLDEENLANAFKLEFYCRIYFAVLPVHPLGTVINPEESRKEMQQFKTFIETHGAQLSKFPECLPFYALPHIRNIQVLSAL